MKTSKNRIRRESLILGLSETISKMFYIFGIPKNQRFLIKSRQFFAPRKFIKFSAGAQLYSQVFIYVLTIILIAFILAYGYNAVQNFKKRAEQVSCLKFKNDLINAIESISSDFGSIKRKDLQLCNGYTQACFVETFESPNLPGKMDPIIKDSILSNTGRNVFLVEKIAKESFYAGKISVEPDVLCINSANNKISLRLEGKGNHVLLGKWE